MTVNEDMAAMATSDEQMLETGFSQVLMVIRECNYLVITIVKA